MLATNIIAPAAVPTEWAVAAVAGAAAFILGYRNGYRDGIIQGKREAVQEIAAMPPEARAELFRKAIENYGLLGERLERHRTLLAPRD